MAAALAESGQFDEAVKAQEKALSLFDTSMTIIEGSSLRTAQPKLEYEARLKLYKENKPYRMQPSRLGTMIGSPPPPQNPTPTDPKKAASEALARANALAARNQLDEAIQAYDEAIRLNSENVFAAYINRGVIWQRKNELDKAMKDFDEAIRLNPKNAFPAYINRGVIWSRKNELDKAIKDLDEAIRLNPNSAVAYSNRADTWNQKKEHDKAIKDIDEAIRLDPKFPSAHYNKACTLALQGKTEPAIESLAKALELGYRNIANIKKDSDLNSIRNDAKYIELLKRYSK